MSVFDDVAKIEDLKYRGIAAQDESRRLANWALKAIYLHQELRRDVESGKVQLVDAVKSVDVFLEGSDPSAFHDIAPSEPAKPDRKPRADKGKPRKPNVTEGRVSPLTPELRSKLEQTLAHGPMQLPEIAKMAWAAELSEQQIEGLLCEDPAAFVSWEDGGQGGPTVWGTVARFDRAVGSLTLQCTKEQRAKYTSAALGCSLFAATEAWKRLDPNA